MVNLEQNGHGVKTVLIERLERLARDLMVQEAIVRDFQKQGFRLVSTTEGPDLCSDDPTRKLIRQVMGAVAEYDSAMTQLKLRAARDSMSANLGRRCEGQKPYGNTPENRTSCSGSGPCGEHDGTEPEADPTDDRGQAQREGIPTKGGKRWTPTQVFNVVGKKKRRATSTLPLLSEV